MMRACFHFHVGCRRSFVCMHRPWLRTKLQAFFQSNYHHRRKAEAVSAHVRNWSRGEDATTSSSSTQKNTSHHQTASCSSKGMKVRSVTTSAAPDIERSIVRYFVEFSQVCKYHGKQYEDNRVLIPNLCGKIGVPKKPNP